MANTTFAALTQPEKIVWSRDTARMARNASFIERFVGKDANSAFQRVTEFSKTEKGARAQIHLISDLTGDGVMGDTELWGKEEALVGSFQTIDIDQIRHANRLQGRMNDQKMVINFREQSRNVLAYWLAERADEMAFLHLSGIPATMKLNGALRAGFTFVGSGGDVTGTGNALYDGLYNRNTTTSPVGTSIFDHASSLQITAPSTNRGFYWDFGTLSLQPRSAGSMVAADTMSYKTVVALGTMAKEKYLRGVKPSTGGGEEEYLLFVGPRSMQRLRLDADFLANARALQTGMGDKGQLANGQGGVLINGVRVIESRYIFNTLGAATTTGAGDVGDPGFKWGAHGANIDGERCLLVGAQALAYADLGLPSWEEQMWDYDNQVGISIGKILGFKKPVFRTIRESSVVNEDFNILTVDVAV